MSNLDHKYNIERVYKLQQMFLNDPVRLTYINHITKLYQLAPIKKVIVDTKNQIVETVLEDSYQVDIDFYKNELDKYEISKYSMLFKQSHEKIN